MLIIELPEFSRGTVKRSEIFLPLPLCASLGADVIILEIFSQKIAKKLAFLTQNKAKLCKFLIITLDFGKTPIFSPKIGKNRRKL
jgi:hypothetical protein